MRLYANYTRYSLVGTSRNFIQNVSSVDMYRIWADGDDICFLFKGDLTETRVSYLSIETYNDSPVPSKNELVRQLNQFIRGNALFIEGFLPALNGVPAGMESGIISLTAGVPYVVTFTLITGIASASDWVMPKSTCVNSSGSEIYPTIVKGVTGFTVTADEDCTYEYLCVKATT